MPRIKVKFLKLQNIDFYIDEENSENIFTFLGKKGTKKLKLICQYIGNKKDNKDIYSTENFNSKMQNNTAFKFKGAGFNNARIYAKDYFNGEKRVIILCELLESKKQTKLTEKEQNIIIKVNNYEYE
jgi:hypothetical protein